MKMWVDGIRAGRSAIDFDSAPFQGVSIITLFRLMQGPARKDEAVK